MLVFFVPIALLGMLFGIFRQKSGAWRRRLDADAGGFDGRSGQRGQPGGNQGVGQGGQA
jgi:hypothetical protein